MLFERSWWVEGRSVLKIFDHPADFRFKQEMHVLRSIEAWIWFSMRMCVVIITSASRDAFAAVSFFIFGRKNCNFFAEPSIDWSWFFYLFPFLHCSFVTAFQGYSKIREIEKSLDLFRWRSYCDIFLITIFSFIPTIFLELLITISRSFTYTSWIIFQGNLLLGRTLMREE